MQKTKQDDKAISLKSMLNQQIVDYINQCLAADQTKEQIKQSLLSAGWQESDIDEAFAGANTNIIKQEPITASKENKKSASNWYVAATHFLTAGFVIPFLFGLLLIIATILFPFAYISFFLVIGAILSILGTWLGVMYSARYVRKKYAIEDKDKVIFLSTAYLIFLTIVYYAYQFFSNNIVIDLNFFTYIFVPFIIKVLVFFIASKRYIQAD